MSTQPGFLSLGNWAKYTELLVVILILAVVLMIIIPVPPLLLDLLMVANISVSFIILLVAMYTTDVLQFSVFPSLLLITTLLRLSLNVSSTRLILLNRGEEIAIVKAFGNFVVGGQYIVGFVVYVIITIILFMVITKGSERVSEVAARFTLDAMPGKQMAIDADLNAGLIREDEAKDRRKAIQQEADFYGAMDGASKFVKGDAIAGIIILVINLIGGFAVGMFQGGMAVTEVLAKFTLLSVGDGLVAQLPSLLISTATGITVTRAASESNLGGDLIKQLLAQPKALAIAAGMLGAMAMVPGLPTIPLLTVAVALGSFAYFQGRTVKESEEQIAAQEEEKQVEEVKKPENVISLLKIDPMELEIGYSLIPLADANQGGDLLDRVIMIRRQCALELGLIVPPIRIRDNMQLKPNNYVIKIKGIEIAEGELLLNHVLAMDPGTAAEIIDGIETIEPAFGLPAIWIPEGQRERAENMGYTVVDPPSIIATHLTEIVKSHAFELLGKQETQTLLDSVKEHNQTVVDELVPALMGVGELQKVLQNLLRERISIRDMVTILETLSDYVRITKDQEVLTEYVRQALSRHISKQFQVMNGIIPVITLDPQLERIILDSVQRTDFGSYSAIDPSTAQSIFSSLGEETQKVSSMGYQPIILCSPMVRLYFKKLTERVAPNLVVLSYNEIEPNIEVQSLGMVSI